MEASETLAMPDLAVSTWPFFSKELGEVLKEEAAADFAAVDIWCSPPHMMRPSELPNDEAVRRAARSLREELASYGVKPLALALRASASPLDNDTEDYQREFNRNLQFTIEAGAVALNEHYIEASAAESLGFAEAFKRLTRVWRECAKQADANDVKLVWEFESGSAFRKPEEIIAIAEELAAPGFGILYDTAHGHVLAETGVPGDARFTPLAGGQLELIQRLEGLIGHVHVADCKGDRDWYGPGDDDFTTAHVPLGQGDVDWKTISTALLRATPSCQWWCLDLYGAPEHEIDLIEQRQMLASILAMAH